MQFQVVYFSRKGSTKKVADAIASVVGVNAEDVKSVSLQKDAFIFLGSGCYGGKPAKSMIRFIEDNDFKTRNVALFGTSGGGEGREVSAMEDLLKTKEASVKGSFFCQGKFWLGNKGKPSDEDLKNAKEFAKNSIK
jgi:flavodoxin I